MSGCSQSTSNIGCGIDSVEDISNEKLKEDILYYIRNSDEHHNLINYYLLTDATPKLKFDNSALDYMLIVPVIGDFYKDKLVDDTLDDYKSFLESCIDDRSYGKKVIDKYIAENKIDEYTHKKFTERYIDRSIGEEEREAIVKFAALKYRLFTLEMANTPGMVFDTTDMVIEVITHVAYDAITGNSDDIKELESFINEIKLALQIKYDIESYWNNLVPLYKYAYRLEPTNMPSIISLNGDNHDLYRLLNGEWESMETHNKIKIGVPPNLYNYKIIDSSIPSIVINGRKKGVFQNRLNLVDSLTEAKLSQMLFK